MFSAFLAWACFILGSALWVFIICYELFKPKAAQLQEDMLRLRGARVTWFNPKIVTVFIIWAISGIYLFG